MLWSVETTTKTERGLGFRLLGAAVKHGYPYTAHSTGRGACSVTGSYHTLKRKRTKEHAYYSNARDIRNTCCLIK